MVDEPVSPPKRFEYTHEHILVSTDLSLTEQLNSYGKQGWELVTCDRTIDRRINDPGVDVYYTCVFKRELTL